MLKLCFNTGIKGLYELTAVCTTTRERRFLGKVDNLITDFGFANWGDPNVYAYCVLGSSGVPPLTTDEDVGEELYMVGFTDSVSGFSESPIYGYRRYRFVIPAGAITETIREIGIKAAALQLVSHALLKDAFGNPIEVDLGPSEELEILYEARSYPTMGDNVQNLTTRGIEYELRSRACAVIGGSQWVPGEFPAGLLAAVCNGPAGDEYGEPSGSYLTINPSEDSYSGIEGSAHFIVWDFKVLVSQGNFGTGIQSMLFLPGGKGVFQVQITPPILKTYKDILNFSVKFRWERL